MYYPMTKNKNKYQEGHLIFDADPWVVAPEVAGSALSKDPVGVIVSVGYDAKAEQALYEVFWRAENKRTNVLERIIDYYCIVLDAEGNTINGGPWSRSEVK